MLLKEIIDDADLYVSNSIPLDRKVRWINQLISNLYRDYPIHDKTTVIQAVPKQQYYDLPSDCTEDRLRAVSVDGCPYDYIEEWKHAILPEMYFTIESGQVKIYPIPDKVVDINIYYMDKPTDLTVNDLETVPSYPVDYQDALAYGLASKIAKVEGTPDQSAFYEAEMIKIAGKAQRDVKRFRQTRVKTTRILM